MPLYFVYCPDYPNNLAKRMEHRKGHVDASAQNKATGKSGESQSQRRRASRDMRAARDAVHCCLSFPLAPSYSVTNEC